MQTTLYNDIYKVKSIVQNARYDAKIRICDEDFNVLYYGKVYGLYDLMDDWKNVKPENNIVYRKIQEMNFDFDGIYLKVFNITKKEKNINIA